MGDFPLPLDTVKAFRAAGGNCRNFGLLFDRFVSYDPNWKLEGAQKRLEAQRLVDEANRWSSDSAYKELFRSLRARWRTGFDAIGALHFEATPEWRLVIGLGRDSAFETGLTLHRVYGFPFIPGSALKGVTRGLAFWEIAQRLAIPAFNAGNSEESRPKEQKTPLQLLEKLLDSDKASWEKNYQELKASGCQADLTADEFLREESVAFFRRVFGSQDHAGQVIFFDALPVSPPRLKLDIMNPHYPEYYSSGGPPADWQSPIPVYFITIETGSRFQFGVGLRRGSDASQETLSRVCTLLQQALEDVGTGGKTTSGYGYWKL